MIRDATVKDLLCHQRDPLKTQRPLVAFVVSVLLCTKLTNDRILHTQHSHIKTNIQTQHQDNPKTQ